MPGASSSIESDLIWRENELASMTRLLISAGKTPAESALLRAACALLYAHFEGFTRFCWEQVFSEIANSGLSVEKLTKPLALRAMVKPFRELRRNSSDERLWDFFREDMPRILADSARFELDAPRTQSNLRSEVFAEGCASIGLQCAELENVRQTMDSLVAKRNQIAHGRPDIVGGFDEYKKLEDAALLLMHDLAIASVAFLENRGYAAPEPP